MDWGALADPRTLTLAGVFLIALVGGYKKLWVYGPLHRDFMDQWRERYTEVTEDRDAWKEIALNVTGTAEKLAETAKKA